jgi:hypothetical protein
MRQTERALLIPMKKGVLLFAFLLFFMANALRAQDYDRYNQCLTLLYQINDIDSIKMVNAYRLYITKPTNNADSIIQSVCNYDSTLLCRKLKLLKQVFFEEEFKIRYGFMDSNSKHIETTFTGNDNIICTNTLNPLNLNSSNDYSYYTKLFEEYVFYWSQDNTTIIDRKEFEKATITIIRRRGDSKRFPVLYIAYLDYNLFYIDFYEAIYY